MTGGINMLLLQFALIGLVFYFLILRPQSQARKPAAAMPAPGSGREKSLK